MKLPRPHIPIAVKIAVAERQIVAILEQSRPPEDPDTDIAKTVRSIFGRWGTKPYLSVLLLLVIGPPPYHLDHDPPLWQRARTRSGGYRPKANDPNYLVWRSKDGHRIKTYVRGDGAQLSDAAKRRKEIKRKVTKVKRKWPSRPMQRRPMR